MQHCCINIRRRRYTVSKDHVTSAHLLPCPVESRVRRSPIHGKGVFALVDIPRGTRIIEYKGARITHITALRQHPANPENPFHTFLFALSDGRYCIDARNGGNAARWINHRCAPRNAAVRVSCVCISTRNAESAQARN
nr:MULTISPECIES: SET domain-containing protein-lysine N-methyltransferase [unclassified Paraburkholderia]